MAIQYDIHVADSQLGVFSTSRQNCYACASEVGFAGWFDDMSLEASAAGTTVSAPGVLAQNPATHGIRAEFYFADNAFKGFVNGELVLEESLDLSGVTNGTWAVQAFWSGKPNGASYVDNFLIEVIP